MDWRRQGGRVTGSCTAHALQKRFARGVHVRVGKQVHRRDFNFLFGGLDFLYQIIIHTNII